MPRTNLNHVVITGNLTADPELRETSAGISVCELRVANNTAVKKDGQWDTKVNYFQANVWGKMGENCAKFLSKGSGVAIDGKLEWQKWQDSKDPTKTNSRVLINVNSIEFLGGGKGSGKPPTEATDTQDSIPF
jgi:single-strand DNA-binding protein